MECLFHEKPFAGVNGSGKHVNFSFGNTTQGNLLYPGDNPHDNAQFLVFCAAIIRAVHQHGGLLRLSVASASNDHRLGANEAPPAIISIFLGDQLADVFDQIAKGGASRSKEKGILNVGVDTLPDLTKDAGDRNRTTRSPSPATASSSAPPGSNADRGRADGHHQHDHGRGARLLRHRARGRRRRRHRLQRGRPDRCSPTSSSDHGAVIFNGNGYSEEWHAEAAQRGLKNLRTTVDALPEYLTPECDRAVREVRRLQRARAAQSASSRCRALRASRVSSRPT